MHRGTGPTAAWASGSGAVSVEGGLKPGSVAAVVDHDIGIDKHKGWLGKGDAAGARRWC